MLRNSPPLQTAAKQRLARQRGGWELFAGAVQAPMGATHSTGLFEARSEGLTGSVKTHGQIILGDVEILRDLDGRFTVQIDTTEKMRVTKPECRQNVVKAFADCRCHFIQRGLLVLTTLSQFLQKRIVPS